MNSSGGCRLHTNVDVKPSYTLSANGSTHGGPKLQLRSGRPFRGAVQPDITHETRHLLQMPQ